MKNYSVLLAPATTAGKNVLPRVAALLDVAQVSDIVEVKAPNVFVRPIYAGNALQTVETTDKIVVATVRTTAFAQAKAPPPPLRRSRRRRPFHRRATRGRRSA